MFERHTLRVVTEDRGSRLDAYLVGAVGRRLDASRAQLQAWIAAGHVRVDGHTASKAHRVVPGELVVVVPPAPQPTTLEPASLPLRVLFEDAHLLVLNKPAHLDVHPGAGPPRVTLVHALLAHCSDLSGIGGVLRPGIVHRLDRGTTGALVVAKNDAAHRHLAAQFAARTVRKTYLALVHGKGPAGARGPGARGRRDTPYGRHRSDRKRFSGTFVAPGRVRRAVTGWQLLAQLPLVADAGAGVHPGAGLGLGTASFSGLGPDLGPGLGPAPRSSPSPYPGVTADTLRAGAALVACTLHTGRTHQLRVHLAELGCPIVGDALYGRGRPPVAALAAPLGLRGLDHQALHAWRLAFAHPVDGRLLRLQAPLPDTWADAVACPLASANGLVSTYPEELPCA